jgi:hypothetical protein
MKDSIYIETDNICQYCSWPIISQPFANYQLKRQGHEHCKGTDVSVSADRTTVEKGEHRRKQQRHTEGHKNFFIRLSRNIFAVHFSNFVSKLHEMQHKITRNFTFEKYYILYIAYTTSGNFTKFQVKI